MLQISILLILNHITSYSLLHIEILNLLISVMAK